MRTCFSLLATLFLSLASTVSAQDETSTITNWDGSNLKVELKAGEPQTFSYTASEQGTLYILATSTTDPTGESPVPVTLEGGLWMDGAYNPDFKLEDTENGYESGNGIYGNIRVWDGDQIRFTLSAEADAKFTMKSFFFDTSVRGNSWESPINLEANTATNLPVYKNYDTDTFGSYSNLTFCRIVAPSDGVASIRTTEYEILYLEEDLFDGSIPFNRAIEGATQYEHEFAVAKGKSYLVAIPNPRPNSVTFKMAADRIGANCNAPIEITEFPASLDLVKGHNWYQMDMSEVGTQHFMEMAISEGWNGTFTYMFNCLVESDELSRNQADGTAKTIYKNLDPSLTQIGGYLYIDIYVNDQATVENGVTLTLREPQDGETCGTAIVAQSGENTCEGPARDYWFSYTPETDCNIELSCDSLHHILQSCGSSNTANRNGNHTYRVYAGNTIYIGVTKKTEENGTLQIKETEIVPGVNCDYPIDFALGDQLVMKDYLTAGGAVILQTTYARFTAEESGYAIIETTCPNWVTSYWTVTFKTDCKGSALPVDRIETEDPNTGELMFRYKVAISAGKTYIFQLTSDYNGGDIVANSRFEEAEQGGTCETAIPVTELNTNIALMAEANATMWYTYTADKSGFYTIAGCAKGTRKVLIGDCGALKNNIPDDNKFDDAYIRGYFKTKVYVEEGTPFFVYIKTSNTPYSDEDPFYLNITFHEAQPGENFAGAVPAKEGVKYDVPMGDDAFDTWYSFTIPAGHDQLIEIGSEVMNYANLMFYSDENTTLSIYKGDFSMEMVYNEENRITGKKYSFPAAKEARTIYINVATQTLPVWWTIHKYVPVNIEETVAVNTLTIAPNPNNGIFSVSVPAIEAGASISVCTLAGAEVYRAPLTSTVTTVNLSGKLGTGIYLVRVNNGTTVTGKMIIK